MAGPAASKTIRHASIGWIAMLIALAFFGPIAASPLYAGAKALDIPREVAMPVIACIALVWGAMVLWWFSTELLVVVDPSGILVTRRSVVGPIRGKVQVDLETRWDKHDAVYDQTGVQQTKHGPVKVYSLVIGKYSLPSSYLGTSERNGLYRELLDAVRAHAGDKLQERHKLGELDDVVRKLVDEQIAARSKGAKRDSGAEP
jgi:hypothetical protein